MLSAGLITILYMGTVAWTSLPQCMVIDSIASFTSFMTLSEVVFAMILVACNDVSVRHDISILVNQEDDELAKDSKLVH